METESTLSQTQQTVTNPSISHHDEETMWSSFQNVLTFIALAVFAGSIYYLWSTFINSWVPVVNNGYSGYVSSYGINNSIAALLVSAPVFISLFFITNKKYSADPQMKKSPSKKLLNYITLIITFIILLSQTIFAITTTLNDKFTVNYGCQILLTFAITGTIFAYYLYEVRIEKVSPSVRVYALGCAVLAVLSIVTLGISFKTRSEIKVKEAAQNAQLYADPVGYTNNTPAMYAPPSSMPQTATETGTVVASATNVPTLPVTADGVSFVIDKAEVTDMSGAKTLVLTVRFSADSTCPRTGSQYCVTNIAGVEVADGNGKNLLPQTKYQSIAIQDAMLREKDSSQGKLYFQAPYISTVYQVVYTSTSKVRSAPVTLQIK